MPIVMGELCVHRGRPGRGACDPKPNGVSHSSASSMIIFVKRALLASRRIDAGFRDQPGADLHQRNPRIGGVPAAKRRIPSAGA